MRMIAAALLASVGFCGVAAGQRTQATRPVWQQIQKLGSPADAEPPPPPAPVHATAAQMQEQARTLADLCRKVQVEASSMAYERAVLRSQLKQIHKLASQLQNELRQH